MLRYILGAVTVLLALIGALATNPPSAVAKTFIVNTDSDGFQSHDVNTADGECIDGNGTCSLRAAIEQANALSGADVINFQGLLQFSITIATLEGPLPALTTQVTIDASGAWNVLFDQPGVYLDGFGGSFNGLSITASGCAIYGLSITGFADFGVAILSNNNTIGGTGAGMRNIISGNGTAINGGGIYLGNAGTGNVIQNNYIGLNAAGNLKMPNYWGIYVSSGASNNTIGGSTPAAGNVISGNLAAGVFLDGASTTGNALGGNRIGVAPIGVSATGLGNAQGVTLSSAGSNDVGGPGLASNIISLNTGGGVQVVSADFTGIDGNVIWANGTDGITIDGSESCSVMFNIIGYNGWNGVRVLWSDAIKNFLGNNSIYSNALKGIGLESGANASLPAPVITSATPNLVCGTVSPLIVYVQVYSDDEDEGRTYHGQTIVNKTDNTWQYTGIVQGPNVTALGFDAQSNTSMFSAPARVDDFDFLSILPALIKGLKN